MSHIRFKVIASASNQDLEKQVNEFLKNEDIELKQFDYQTDGYEKPYSVALLYRDIDSNDGKRREET